MPSVPGQLTLNIDGGDLVSRCRGLPEAVCKEAVTLNISDSAETTPPTAVCKEDFLLEIGDTYKAVLKAEDVDNGSSDDCLDGDDKVGLSLSKTEFTSAGVYTVTLTVTDRNSNTATCQTTVTVEPCRNSIFRDHLGHDRIR